MFKLIIDKKALTSLTGAKVKINREVAVAVADALYEEFYKLVMRTPQWSGYTAASWNIGYGPDAGKGKDVPSLKADRKKLTGEKVRRLGMQAGHMQAVGMATMRSHRELEQYKNGDYRRGDLVIWNDSEETRRMIDGDVRPENRAGIGAIEDFEREVEASNIVITNTINI